MSTTEASTTARPCRLAYKLPDVSASVARAYLDVAKVRKIAVIDCDRDLRMVVLRRLRQLRAPEGDGRRDPVLAARIVLVAAALGVVVRP